MPRRRPAKEIGLKSGKGSRTQKSEGPITDVNTIVNRYMRSGEMTHWNGAIPRYGDFSQVEDLQAQLNAVHELTDQFQALPAIIKDKAGHDPVRFLEMLADPEGTEVLVNAGLTIEDDRLVTSEPPAEEAEATSEPEPTDAPPEE